MLSPFDLQTMLRLINEERKACGIHPLRRSGQLDRIARRRVIYLTWCGAVRPQLVREEDPQALDHRLRDADVSFSCCGENVGIGASAEEVVRKLMVGITNRRNILNPAFQWIGLSSRAFDEPDLPDWFARVLYCQVFTD
jgi:uncharacterized protein YkwD